MVLLIDMEFVQKMTMRKNERKDAIVLETVIVIGPQDHLDEILIEIEEVHQVIFCIF